MGQSDNHGGSMIDVHLDVQNIEETAAFGGERLGFEGGGDVRLGGTFLEVISMARADVAGFRVTFHCCAPSPVAGSWKGSLKRICLRVADLEQAVARIGKDAKWMGDPSTALDSGGPLRVLDPNGYQIELQGGPRAGS